MDWLQHVTVGWTRREYLTVVVVIVPFVIALITIIISTHHWRKRFGSKGEVGTYVLLWLVIAVVAALVLALCVRFGLPPLDTHWLNERPSSVNL